MAGIFDDDEGLFDGIPGLWARVLLLTLGDLSKPLRTSERQAAEHILTNPTEGTLPIIADALGIPLPELVKKMNDRHAVVRQYCRDDWQKYRKSNRRATRTVTR